MKYSVEELIATYEKRVKVIDKLIEEANDNLTKIRQEARKLVYQEVIKDLNYVLRDAKDPT